MRSNATKTPNLVNTTEPVEAHHVINRFDRKAAILDIGNRTTNVSTILPIKSIGWDTSEEWI